MGKNRIEYPKAAGNYKGSKRKLMEYQEEQKERKEQRKYLK